MILTILILLGIGLAIYTCILHSIGPILGILLAVGYTLGCIIIFLLLVALLSVFIRIDRPADRRTRFYHWLMTNIVQVGMFLLRVRVNAAGRMLADTDRPVADIAQATGFYDQSYFTKHFRRRMKLTPTAYRQAYRTAPVDPVIAAAPTAEKAAPDRSGRPLC